MEDIKLKIEYLKIDDLKAYERNTRKHEKESVETIKNSIKKFGMCDPIGIWGKKNTVVEGHGRLMALKELGYKKVPVIRLDHLTDKERRAYGIAHNKTAEMSEWDKEMLELELEDISTKIDMNDFGFDLSEKSEKEKIDKVPVIRETKIAQGDMFMLGNHRLLCGDATSMADVEKLVGNTQIDLVFSDPPYNVDVTGGTEESLKIENDHMSAEAFQEFITNSMKCMLEPLKAGGSFYIWHASKTQREFENAINEAGLEVKQQLIWVKNHFTLGRQDYQWCHELCYLGFREGQAHYFTEDRTLSTVIDDIKPKLEGLENKSKEELLEIINKWLEIPQTVIRFDKPVKNEDHPTMKPVDMCEYLIKNSTKPNENVLDCFGGSGSTLIACEKSNRNCLMLEIDPKYCQSIIDRYIELTENEEGVIHIALDGTVTDYKEWKKQ